MKAFSVQNKMKKNIGIIFTVFVILVDFGVGIVVRGSKPTEYPYYEVTYHNTEYSPYNDVDVFDEYAINDRSNWRAYLSTADFKHAWGRSKSFIETLVDKVNEGFNAINATVMETLKNTNFQAIYWGTLWCGDGTRARENKEVGYFYQTDACCRAHDLCPDAIDANKTKFNLTNTGRFTRSSCDCDQKFYQCLKTADTMVSRQIGYIFFNILGPQCFRKEYPIVNCTKWVRKRCHTYIVDDEQEKLYQWFDNKRF